MRRRITKAGLAVVLALGALLASPIAAPAIAQAPAPSAPPAADSRSTTDHSKLEPLQQTFGSGPEVTAACLSCHTEADDQVMHTVHYTWDYTHPATGQRLGKRNILNSFCGNVATNDARCTSCHTGYGWEDVREAAPADPTRVDCLACHDRSGQYAKQDNLAGHPPLAPLAPGAKTITGAAAWPVDLARAARSVGPPGRETCGSCHFYGGGGDNVKHGDLSSVLLAPPAAVDVHMTPDGRNFSCAVCHVSDRHRIAGSRYSVLAEAQEGPFRPGKRRDVATCESCHTATPHPATLIGWKLDDHVDRVACQTCHIPAFARGGVATKTVWDWSTAGELEAGEPIARHDFTQSDGTPRDTYLSTKGTFAWAEDVVPTYAWFNGEVGYTTGLVEIDPAEPVLINRIEGSADDGRSRIWPFKVMVGKQAYDTELRKLVHIHTYGPATDTAFWTNFDWDKAIEAAMAHVGEPFSGSYDFIETQMYWPITHMVAPAAAALQCGACHAPEGRMAALAGVHVPGAEPLRPAGLAGLLLLTLTGLGVAGHVVLRLVSRGGGRRD